MEGAGQPRGACSLRRSLRNRIFIALLPFAFGLFRLQDTVYRLIGKTDWGVPTHPPPVPVAQATAGAPAFGFVPDRHGYRLFYRAWPPPARQARAALVAIDGMGSDAKQFHPLGPALAPRGVAVYGLDTLGQGLSDGPRSEWSLLPQIVDGVADFIAFLGDAWSGRPVYLLGESLGGPLALELAIRPDRPLNLAGLILASPELEPTRLTAHDRWATLALVLQQLPSFLLASLAPSVDISGRERLVARDPHVYEQSLRDPLRNNRVSVRSMIAAFALISRAFDRARQMTLPTLVLQAECDLVTDPLAAAALVGCLATGDKELVFFPGAAHGLFYDPETPRVLQVIAGWLERHWTTWTRPRPGCELLAPADFPEG